MKKSTYHSTVYKLRIGFIFAIIATISFFMFSFRLAAFNTDLLAKLGMSKSAADEKITNSILGGYLDAYGVKNLKTLATGSKAAVAKDLLVYTKKHVSSPEFIKEYKAMKMQAKPEYKPLQTPDAMQKESVERLKKSVTDLEASIKKSDESMKKIFDKMLVDVKKQLKEAEAGTSEHLKSYRENYEESNEIIKSNYELQLAAWDAKYPENHMLFVKQRLEEFLKETEGIDFSATTIEKNGKKIFENRAYESKSARWKMCYRAGKEVIGTAREFVKQWISEL
jgi:uncharacterized coiled-coil protein SlyX